MKIRNLLVLTMTMALTTLCVSAQQSGGNVTSVSAQQGWGNVTITDSSNQSLTISRFGTVVRFKDKNDKLSELKHTYKICTCGKQPRCIEPNSATEQAQASLKAVFPKPGKKLKMGQSLKAVAIVKLGGVTVTRRLAWPAGSSVVYVVETVTADKAEVCSISESGLVMLGDSCPMPPPGDSVSFKCPPPPPPPPVWFSKFCSWKGHLLKYSIDLSRRPVEP